MFAAKADIRFTSEMCHERSYAAGETKPAQRSARSADAGAGVRRMSTSFSQRGKLASTSSSARCSQSVVNPVSAITVIRSLTRVMMAWSRAPH